MEKINATSNYHDDEDDGDQRDEDDGDAGDDDDRHRHHHQHHTRNKKDKPLSGQYVYKRMHFLIVLLMKSHDWIFVHG